MKLLSGVVVLLVLVGGAQAHVPASAPVSELSWRVVSADASAVLEQTATGPGACPVNCTRPKQQPAQVWSADRSPVSQGTRR